MKTYTIKYVSIETSSDMFGEKSLQEGYAVYDNNDVRVSFVFDKKEDAEKDMAKLQAQKL